MRLCKDCRHFKSVEDGPRTGIWYNLYCTHPDLELPSVIDPITGETVCQSQNDLGRVYGGKEKYPHCRDINTDGNCHYYEGENRNGQVQRAPMPR